MLYLEGTLLGLSLLPAQGDYPPSHLASVFDTETNDTLNLLVSAEAAEVLTALEPFTKVMLALRWRRVDLRQLGGTGRGKAYRLSVATVVN